MQPTYCVNAYTGHGSHVMSLDFHPKKTDLFCFSDSNNEIRYWNISPFSCTRVFKVGSLKFPFTCLLSLIFFKIPSKAAVYSHLVPNFCFSLEQGGNVQVRFQPRIGHLLAAAMDKVVSIFDVETDRQIHSLQVSVFVKFCYWF